SPLLCVGGAVASCEGALSPRTSWTSGCGSKVAVTACSATVDVLCSGLLLFSSPSAVILSGFLPVISAARVPAWLPIALLSFSWRLPRALHIEVCSGLGDRLAPLP